MIEAQHDEETKQRILNVLREYSVKLKKIDYRYNRLPPWEKYDHGYREEIDNLLTNTYRSLFSILNHRWIMLPYSDKENYFLVEGITKAGNLIGVCIEIDHVGDIYSFNYNEQRCIGGKDLLDKLWLIPLFTKDSIIKRIKELENLPWERIKYETQASYNSSEKTCAAIAMRVIKHSKDTREIAPSTVRMAKRFLKEAEFEVEHREDLSNKGKIFTYTDLYGNERTIEYFDGL